MNNNPFLSLFLALGTALALVAGALLLLEPAAGAQAAAPSATITVTSNADAAVAGDGLCTLREALANANANTDSSGGDCAAGSGVDTITFAIGAPGSLQTISPTTNLPTISDPVVLDGWSQGGAGYTGPPLIELSGENLTAASTRGLRITSGNSTVRGFAINRFAASGGSAIWLHTADGNWIYGNYVGVSTDGTTALPNHYGIWLNNRGNTQPSGQNIIGTNGDGVDDAAEGNVIAGNIQENIRVETSGNWIAGNRIGTNAAGDASLGGNNTGVRLYGASGDTTGDNNVIGTNGDGISDAVEGNLISGQAYGIGFNNSSGHTIAGNIIGLDVTGSAIIGNDFNGIDCNASANSSRDILIGSDGDGVSDEVEGNVISGNGSRGYSTFYNNCRHITISGNKIGTDLSGTTALGNGAEGIIISAGDWYTITSNIISGNGTNGTAAGISTGNGANSITIANNVIGSDTGGTADLGNTGDGIEIQFSDNYIIHNNQIGGNGSEGVMINGGDAIQVEENLIGVQADTNGALENEDHGVFIFGNATRNNIVSNTIAYSGRHGVLVDGSSQTISNTISANNIFNNAELGIDLDFDGVTPTDQDDVDTGPNGLQNHPALLTATNTADYVTIGGVLDSTPETTFTLEFFSSSACDPAGNGEGADYLGSDTVTTLSGSGAANDTPFSSTLPVLVPEGRYLTATATGPEGTSEFSVCFGPTGPVQDTSIGGLAVGNNGPQLDHNLVVLTATVSSGSNVTYAWDPGDGSGPINGRVVTHTYTAPGIYTALVTATNSISQETASTAVTINRSSSLSGYVWDDVDGDGTLGPGETRFGEKTVRVEQNGLVFTATTAANGSYLLRGLEAGSYTLFSPAISGYKPFGASVRILSMPITGAAVGQSLSYQADFAGVRGRAWLDDNLNGRWDNGETLLTNHPVSLMVMFGPHPEYPQLTDDNGLFRFDLASTDGPTQRLSADTPAGYEPLSRTLNGAESNGYTSNLNFSPGAVLGCVTPSGGAVASGLTVTLRNNSGQETATTTTDGDGCYLFTPDDAQGAASVRLTPAGSDLVVGPERQPAVYLGTPLQIDWDVTAPSSVGVQLYSVDGVPHFSSQHDFSGYEVHLATGSGLLTATTDSGGYASFETVTPGLITATVPLSGDNIGVTPSRWEYDLPPGAALNLTGFELGTHGVTAECRTPPVPGQEPNGRAFPCTVELRYLLATTPLVSQTLTAGEQFFFQPATPTNESYNTVITITPDLPNGAELAASDSFFMRQGGTFHYRYPYFLPEQVAPISGEVWTDANANGGREPNEGAAIGITVELLDSSLTVVETTTTDGYGRYQFYPDGFGHFRVRLAVSDNVLPTTFSMHFIHRDNEDLTGDVADFGIALLSEGIDGQVHFSDQWRSNASGVTVELRSADSSSLLETAVTGPTGHFHFDSLLPGNYLVRVLPPNGGTAVDRLVTASVSGTPLQEIILPPDGNRPTIFVYADENGNGVADSDEGLPGVAIAFDVGVCGNVVDTDVTDDDGFAPADLVFPNGGCARVTSGLPAGMSPARPDGVLLAPYDGGIVPLRLVVEGTLQLRPFWDRNGNGQEDPGEPLRLDDVAVNAPGLDLLRTSTQLFLTGPTGTYDNIWVGTLIGSTAMVMRPMPTVGVISSVTENVLPIPLGYENTLTGEVVGPNSGAVSGLTIELRDEDNTLIDATTTGVAPISQPGGRSYTPPPAATGGPAAATFTFDDVAPGSYTVRAVNLPANLDSAPAEISFDPANGGSVRLRLNPIDTVSGVVYWDHDYNGRRNSGEPGTQFYDVVLLNDAGLPEQRVTPAADGSFVFTGLQPDVQYALTVPALYQEIGGFTESNWVSDAPGWFERGALAHVAIGIGHYDSESPNSLAIGRVYLPNSGGVAGATVGYYQLQNNAGFCNDGNATILGETTTDTHGRYALPLTFVPIDTVRYCLVVLEAPGLVQDDLTVTAISAAFFQYENGRIYIYRAINDTDIRMRPVSTNSSAAGERAGAAARDVTWSAFRDNNLNGMWDEGEFPLPGVVVESVTLTATSGLDGSGQLTLADGEHELSISAPAGYATVGPAERPVWIAGSDVELPPVGFAPAGRLSGILFADKDGDGWPGSTGDEFGLGGITVTLSGPVVTTTVSAADGRFGVSGLPDGTYTVSAAASDAYVLPNVTVTITDGFGIARLPAQAADHLTGALYRDWDGDGLRLANEELAATVPFTITVGGIGDVLPLGGNVLFWDVEPGTYTVQPWWTAAGPATVTLDGNSGGGFRLPAVDPGVVRGVLWLDANDDGVRQPWETPLSGIPVTLNGADSVFTGPDGRYTFVNVVTGTHTLEVALPDGLSGAIPPVVVADGRGAAAGIPVTPAQPSFTIYLPAIMRPYGRIPAQKRRVPHPGGDARLFSFAGPEARWFT